MKLQQTTRDKLSTVLVLAIFFITLPRVDAQTSDRPDGMRFVPDPANQFRALTERPDPLGLRIGDTPNPSTCRHYQAMARVDGADGTPFFLVSRSGNTPFPPGETFCDDSPGETRNGNLVIFRMGSRDKNGERLRSNRLQRGVHVNDTVSPVDDVATIYYTVVDGGLVLGDGPGPGPPPRVYQHPGGMQVVGKMLALAVEHPRGFPPTGSVCTLACTPVGGNPEICEECRTYQRATYETLIMFFDVSNPEAPVFKSQFAPRLANGTLFEKAGAVAITPLPNGLYLMVVIGNNNSDFHFFRSTIADLSSEFLDWEPVDRHPGPGEDDDHQTLNFLREGNIDGRLYLAGARGRVDLPFTSSDRDRIDLYEVTCASPECNPGEDIGLTRVHTGQRIAPFPNTGGSELLSLAAANGFYVSPTGELMLYATEHDNDGPHGIVKAGEWRHRDTVRPGSPTLLPTARVNGPIEMDEGASITLTGTAGSPITKAWIQLYERTDFNESGVLGFGSDRVMVDHPDYDLDNFDDFFALEPSNGLTHGNIAHSMKWFAPVGCTIRAIDRREGRPDQAKTLVGDGAAHGEPDLRQVLNDAGTDDMAPQEDTDHGVDKVDFLGDCDAYYNSPFLLQWDLDVNGSFETTGSPVTFSALAFDGPSVVNVPAQAVHPSGGQPGLATAVVTVRNVAPEISQFGITDGAGNQLNIAVPFALTGLPLTLGSGFTDPGVLDHQAAAINWGDGVIESNTAFTTFNEAFGDGVGAVSHTHTYNVSGTYALALAVADDDGGMDAEATTIRVVTPEQAVEEIIGLLDNIIAGTPNGNVRKDLEKARKALVGNPDGNNGALEKIRNGNTQAAIAFLDQAIRDLRDAQAGGANVSMLIALLEQVSAALSAG